MKTDLKTKIEAERARETYLNELVEIFEKTARSRTDLRMFLEDLLSPSELEEVARRWQIVKLLDRGLPHRQIAKKVHTSVSTVTRGAREMLDEKGGFQKALEMISR